MIFFASATLEAIQVGLTAAPSRLMMALVLVVLIYALSDGNFLPVIAKCSFAWLAMDGYFGEIVKNFAGGDFKVSKGDALKIMALAYCFCDAPAFPKERNPSQVLTVDPKGDHRRFLDIIRLIEFCIWAKGQCAVPHLLLAPCVEARSRKV